MICTSLEASLTAAKHVLCALSRVRITNRAAQFWILCKRIKIVRERAWTKVLRSLVVIYGRISGKQRI